MAGQRGDHQHLRLLAGAVLGEFDEVAEGKRQDRLLGHVGIFVADQDLVDAEFRPRVGQAGFRRQLEECQEALDQAQFTDEGQKRPERRCLARHGAKRLGSPGIGLVGMIKHASLCLLLFEEQR